MDLSRRDLFRSAGALGGVVALGSLADEALAGTGAATRDHTTLGSILAKGPEGRGGWRPVVRKAGEPHLVRTDLGARAKDGRKGRRKPLLAFAQLSDVHICDAQSPMRAESAEAFSSSAYRPQEILTAHVAEAMVREINKIGSGPVTGKPLAFALQTGDNSDNAQYNEVRWNITVLDGGELRLDSGDPTRYEGVMDAEPTTYNKMFWHPGGTPDGLAKDKYRKTYGFPVVPGLLHAARRPFQASGLDIQWFSALGNHDPLVQGNFAWNGSNNATAIGSQKNFGGVVRTVTADPDRRLMTKSEIVEEHFTTAATPGPVGHGFTQANRDADTAYYTFDRGHIRFVVLDSVNSNGGSEGSLDPTQFGWLKEQLAASGEHLVMVASHHTVGTMDNTNTGAGDTDPRVLGPEVAGELLRHKNVIAWVNGHTHTNNIWAHQRESGGGFWEINTASHIDWPQQARLLEVTDNKDGTLSIFSTMLDHAAPPSSDGRIDTPMRLASLARELAANDRQDPDNNLRRGRKDARNVELLVKAPSFLQ